MGSRGLLVRKENRNFYYWLLLRETVCFRCGSETLPFASGLSEGEGLAAAGETMEPEAELGHCYPPKEFPMPPPPQALPCPPGESHNHPGSLPRLSGKVRRQGIALCPCLAWQGEDVPGQASPHVGSQPALQWGILLGQLLMECLELNGDQQGCRRSSWWEQVCCRLTCCRWRRDFPALRRGSSRNTPVIKTVIVACFVVVLILWWLEQRM